MTDRRTLLRWTLWLAAMGLTTAILVGTRGVIEQPHAALAILLVVLGGSASGGRALGYTLAVLGFLSIDYYFQRPYELLSVGKALDWLVLGAFMATAFVATELVARARAEAAIARMRTEEVMSLSRLGSESLRHAQPDDALNAVSALICTTVGARWCTIRALHGSTAVTDWTSSVDELSDSIRITNDQIARAAERITDAISNHYVAALIGDAVKIDSLEVMRPSGSIRAIGLPLILESRFVGVAIVGGTEQAPLALDAGRQRFLATISYYAALGIERVRLAEEAQQVRSLREMNRAKDVVLASVSHDFSTPLTTIKLLAQAGVQSGNAWAAEIEGQADRLAELVTNVLDLSRIRAGVVPLELALNTAEDVIAAAVSRAHGILRGRTITTSIAVDQPVLIARFDFVQTLRILGNLLDNALRYTPAGGTVQITANREEQWLVMRVFDRGPGVPTEERERIFEAFYRPRSEAPDAGSAGLGLSIARQLAELQAGLVQHESRVGGGSVFSLRLPAVDWQPD